MFWLFVSVLGMCQGEESSSSLYSVEGTLSLKDRSRLGTTELVLNGGEYRTFSRTDGSFVFYDVQPGIYLLDVLSVDYFFSQIKLSLPDSIDQQIQCVEYKYPGATKVAAPYPLRLVGGGKKQYFDVREQPGLHTLFRNPMMLMLVVTGGLVVLMPKMMENMDPDEMKKMQEQMGAANDPAQMLKNLFGVDESKEDDENDPSKQIGDS